MQIQFKKNGFIDPELFSTKAKEIAEEVFEGQNRTKGKANKPSQIRKFYDEVLRFDAIIKGAKPEKQDEELKKLLPFLKMLNAKVAYAEGRDLVTYEFKQFIKQSLEQINTKEDFDIFVSLFEAFMGFYKYYDEKGERPQKEQNKGGKR